jgi:LacI family transcriptional regulator
LTRPTMTEIAHAAGVSQGTVSLVLNDQPTRISPATRARILEAAQSLGYQIRPRRPRVKPTTGTVGLLVDEIGNFLSRFVEGVESVTAPRGAPLAIIRTKGERRLEEAAIATLRSTNLLGVLLATNITREVSLPVAVQGLPVVLLNCYAPEGSFASVLPDDFDAAYSATQTLLRAGHRRIAHIAGEDWTDAGFDREQGYLRALLDAGIKPDPSLVRRGDWTLEGGRRFGLDLLRQADRPTAIFCFHDRLAAGVYEAVHESGLSVPDDVSIFGFDDEDDFAKFMDPPMSSVLLPYEEMGRRAAKLLFREIDRSSPQTRNRTVLVDCPIVSRNSVGPPPSALSALGD